MHVIYIHAFLSFYLFIHFYVWNFQAEMFQKLFASDKSKRWFGFITSILEESNGKFLLGEKVSDNLLKSHYYLSINRA